MNNVFNKYEFINKNNEFLYRRLEDFLRTEVNTETFSIIYNFLELQNFRSGEYEGNQYLIQKKNTQEVLIIDIVSEEFCDDFSQTRFSIRVNELLQLMDEMKTNI
jgi:molybdenum cofactor biosynthesis enzyme MoaA